ncbi:uncharacterized protein LOC129921499 [Episyrphus balteatus]|uniref:uncharacterized protein LOC129921499 n=1 Tax=Episyrphus balteatus TaxID=286459 RepID=UPI002486A682|nr:uncharacterized protein LOC129921499 [Episyrphus balteatus]
MHFEFSLSIYFEIRGFFSKKNMVCRLIGSILFLLIAVELDSVYGFTGYKWVALKTGDKLPENIVSIQRSKAKYVGRARHFDEVLPAEITANGSSFISSCHKEIAKDYFEILTTSDECEWKQYSNSKYEEIDETVVRVGTAWNGEPIYIGLSDSNEVHVTSIYLTKRETYTWFLNNNGYYSNYRFLSCNVKSKWIDTLSTKLPNNTVSGGKSADGHKIFVARLKRDCDVVTGQVIPKLGKATGVLNNGRTIESAYCQVLVGEPKEYTWVAASDGEIPDYAIVHGKNGYELSYIVKLNRTINHLTYSKAVQQRLNYDILVVNQSL